MADSASGECPGCRTPYDLVAVRQQRVHIAQPPPRKAAASRQSIADVVVLDKKVVLVENLPLQLMEAGGAREEDVLATLRQHFLFGQYGRVLSAVTMRGRLRGGGSRGGKGKETEEAFHCALRFSTPEEAAAAVQGAHHAELCGNTLAAALTPTRYCNSFLMNRACKKGGCVELHQVSPGDKSMYVKGVVAHTLSVLGPIAKEGPPSAEGSTTSVWTPACMTEAAARYHATAVSCAQRCCMLPAENDPVPGPAQQFSSTTSPWDVVRAEAVRLEGGAMPPQGVLSMGDSFGTRSPLMLAAASSTSFNSDLQQSSMSMLPQSSSSIMFHNGSTSRLESCLRTVVADAFDCQCTAVMSAGGSSAQRRKGGRRNGERVSSLGGAVPLHTPGVVLSIALPHPQRARR